MNPLAPAFGSPFRWQPFASQSCRLPLRFYRSYRCCASTTRLLFSNQMENLFIVLGFLQVLVGLYLAYQGVTWLAYVRRRAATDPGFYSPRTAVLCPCKGVEPGLERNLTALCEFDHQNYEIFFILAAESDPAAGIVKRSEEHTSELQSPYVIS